MKLIIQMVLMVATVSLVASGCSKNSGSNRSTRTTKSQGAGDKGDLPRIPRGPQPGDEDTDDQRDERGRGEGEISPDDLEDLDGDNSGGKDGGGSVGGDVEGNDGEVVVLGNTHQCGDAYQDNIKEWSPGLLFPPAVSPILTGGKTLRGFRYTDSHDDSVMSRMAEKFRRMDDCEHSESLKLAQRISYVDVFTDISGDYNKSGKSRADVSIELYDGSLMKKGRSEKRRVAIQLTGQFNRQMNATRENIKLIQTNTKGARGLKFEARLTCLDENRGCQSTRIELIQLDKNGKPCRRVFIVFRHGNAHITMDQVDLALAKRIPNKHHSRLAQILANTANRNCQSVLRQVRNGDRGNMPMCAVKRLKNQCENLPIRGPYAKVVGLKTWSVLYGAAKFSFYVDNILKLDGPLVDAPIRPIFDGLVVSAGKGVRSASLVNNDGAGQLAFELRFRGANRAETMNFTVSSLLQDVREANKRIKRDDSVDLEVEQLQFRQGRENTEIPILPGKAYDPDEEVANGKAKKVTLPNVIGQPNDVDEADGSEGQALDGDDEE